MSARGLVSCLKSEMWIAARSLATYLAVLLPSVVVVVYLLMNRAVELTTEARERFVNVDTPFDGAYATGFGHLVDSMLVALTCIVLIMTTYAAWSLVNDYRTGTVRHLVTRVASRHAVFLAKFASVHVLAIVTLVLAIATAYVLAGSLWTYESVVEDGYELISESEIRSEILLGAGLALITIPASIALGVLVSVVSKSPVQSTTITLAVLVMYGLFQPYFGSYADYCFLTFTPLLFDASYLRDVSDIVRGYSDVYTSASAIRLNLWVPLIQGTAMCALAYFIIDRRRL